MPYRCRYGAALAPASTKALLMNAACRVKLLEGGFGGTRDAFVAGWARRLREGSERAAVT